MGFTKLDENILQSSVMMEDPNTFKVFITLLAACRGSSVAKLSPVYLASVCRMSLDDVVAAIERLESPDPMSRSTNDEGRRIRRVDGGYEVINYQKYRAYSYSDSPDAVRQRQKRERDMALHVTKSRDISVSVLNSLSSQDSEKKGKSDPEKETPRQTTAKARKSSKALSTSPWIPPAHLSEVWTHFETHRKAMRKPLTDYARDLVVASLGRISGLHEGQVAALREAISHGWMVPYPPKVEPQRPRYPAPAQESSVGTTYEEYRRPVVAPEDLPTDEDRKHLAEMLRGIGKPISQEDVI